MDAQPDESETESLAVRLAVAELSACSKIIEQASAADGESVRTWSRSTIANALFAVEPTEGIARMVHRAWREAAAFVERLVERDAGPDLVHAQRRRALEAIRRLIAEVEEAARLPGIAWPLPPRRGASRRMATPAERCEPLRR